MVSSILVAAFAILICFNFALPNANAATFLNNLRAGSLPQDILKPSDASQHDHISSRETEWNVMHHQGGNSPWYSKQYGIVESGIEPPPGCRIDQVHMVGSQMKCTEYARLLMDLLHCTD